MKQQPRTFVPRQSRGASLKGSRNMGCQLRFLDRVLPSFESRQEKASGTQHLLLIIVLIVFPILAPPLSSTSQTNPAEASALDQISVTAPRPAVIGTRSKLARFGFGAKISTLGLGFDAGIRITQRANLRLGANAFALSRTVDTSDGVTYAAGLRLRSISAVADLFPLHSRFHISPGVLVYNANRVRARIFVPPGKEFIAEGTTALSNPQNPVSGIASTNFRKFAPMLLVGFGNLFPHERHLSFSVDGGIVFQGGPNSDLTLAGSACDKKALHCEEIADAADVVKEIKSDQARMNRALSVATYYPVVSLEVGYRF